MAWTKAVSDSVFYKRLDLLDPRLSEWVTSFPITSPSESSLPKAADTQSWALLGYPDDEGIGMNGGRKGASEAPDMIRTTLYKMTPSLARPQTQKILDLGNISLEVPLAERHQRGRQLIAQAQYLGYKTLSLGGGHDYGYADGAGFLDHSLSLKKRPVLINFDAHLDVRPLDKGFHSGTAFHRLLTDYAGQFDFFEVGLQNQCNSAAHLQWAKDQGAKIVLLDEIRQTGLRPLLQKLFAAFAGRPCFISVDIDAFSLSEAPGCSQSWTSGLHHQEFAPVLRDLQDMMDVHGLGIYEVSPPLDIDRHTSKLAALILHQFIFHS